ncbi:MAG: PDZ domain-containing protein [Acidobacteriota bacterium]
MRLIFLATARATIMLFALAVIVAAKSQVDSKEMIEYTIGWQNPNSHLFEISIRVATNNADTLDFALPSWRPGRYLIQNYARNVREFNATNEQGKPLNWCKTEKSSWRVETDKARFVEVRYKYYANTLDAGSSLLDESEAYFNGTNLFMYLPGRRTQPCRLTIHCPQNWAIATALTRTEEQTFQAADYEELADSPLIASPTLIIHQFKHGTTNYYLAIQGKLEYDLKMLADQIGKIVAAQVKLFGTAPFENYWFLYHLPVEGRWHGVEHRDSTSIVAPQSAFKTEMSRQRFFSLSSHEFFHVWNVKRIRPQVFDQPDYSREVYTRLLWFFEGVTSYYGDLLLKRAGVCDESAFLTELEKTINELQNTPSRLIVSVEEASFNGWLQPDDAENAQLSFYTKGELIGLLLDLEIRRRTQQEKSLDDVMRFLNERYAERNLGVPEDGIQKALETVTGNSFDDFSRRFLAGRDELPYNQFLSVVGLQVVEEIDKSRPEVSLGFKLNSQDPAVITNVLPDSPALAAGLDRGDILLAVDNLQVNAATLPEALMNYKPGDRVTVTVFRNRRLHQFEVTLASGGNTIYRVKRVDNPTPAQQRALASWLGGAK